MKDFSTRPAFTKSAAEVAADIAEFAKVHGLHIQPGKPPESWAEVVIKVRGCPCEPERLKCPCDKALSDIEQEGTCRCNLFADDGYMEFLQEWKSPSV